MPHKSRVFQFLVGLSIVILGFVCKTIYRPYAYINHLQDFGFSNSSPSLFYVAGFSLLLSFHPGFKFVQIVITVSTASILYEAYQYVGSQQFDISDSIYSIIGGILALLIHMVIKPNHKNVYR